MQENTVADPSNHENGSIHPTLEQLFTTQNPAAVVMFDISNGYGVDRRLSLLDLVSTYKPLFGNKKEIVAARDDSAEGFLWLTQERKDYGETDDSLRMRWIKEHEAETMAKILFVPSADPEQIRQRRQFLEYLSSSNNLDNLITLKNQAYNLIAGLEEISAYYNDVPLIDLYYEGLKKIPIYEDEHGYEVIGEEEVLPLISIAVDMINAGMGSIKDLSATVAAQQNSLFQQALSEFPSFITGVEEELTSVIPFDKAETPEPKKYRASNHLSDLLKEKIKPYLFRVGAVLEFARRIRDEGWGKVSSDPSMPDGYVGGWNLERLKSQQVHNDSPVDAPITILSGANTSGKSFTMKSDFFIRVAAQSLGFAPVRSANLPQFDSFIFLERAATDPQNDLSAFMREVENWKLALKNVNARTRLYVDEGYSTTSPHDQANLLLATAGYIQRRGGSMMLATHNDLLLDIAEQNPHMQVYNLQTEVDAVGELKRHFKLQPGRSEALSYAVARAKQFSPSALAAANDYLQRGKIEPAVAFGADYPTLSAKSPEQREQEKQIASTLEQLFPNDPISPVFHLFSLDPEMKQYELLWHVSDGRQEETSGIHHPYELQTLLGQMVLWQPSQTPAEVLERQKLFQELIKESLYGRLSAMTEQIGFLEETVAVVGRYAKDGVNKGLNPFQLSDEEIAKMIKDIDSYTDPRHLSSMLKAVDAYLGIQVKLFGELPMISDLRNRYKALGEVNDALIQRWQPYRENPGQRMTVQELHKAIVGLFASLREVSDQLPAVGIKDFPVHNLAGELDVLETYSRGREKKDDQRPKRSGIMWQIGESLDLMSGGLPLAVRRLPAMMDNGRLLVQTLKSTDSVHLHQAANLIESQFAKYEAVLSGEAGEVVGEEIQSTTPEDTISRFDHLNRRSSSLFFGRQEPQATLYKATLKHLEALAMFAGIIEQQGFAKVAFNDTGEVHFEDSFSIFKKRNDEVANAIDFSPNITRVQLLTGPNGSGKTFYEKAAVTGILIALATGYAPAKLATMPVFDAVAYLDRVVEKQDKSYSAFSQELEYWKELLGLLPTRKAVFAAVDEAFSSTSPFYQAAFTYAVIAEFLQSNHFLMLSTHNHNVVERLKNALIGLIQPYHFQFSVVNGKVVYHYTKHEGHETSYAVEVARTVGLPDEIISSVLE